MSHHRRSDTGSSGNGFPQFVPQNNQNRIAEARRSRRV